MYRNNFGGFSYDVSDVHNYVPAFTDLNGKDGAERSTIKKMYSASGAILKYTRGGACLKTPSGQQNK